MMEKHNYPGRLIAVEGLDGCGKTVQTRLLKNYLETEGWATVIFKRKMSKLIAKRIDEAKKNRQLNPLTYSLIHVADFSELYFNDVLPALKAGYVVIFNKYVYTAMAKDYLRGNDRQWIDSLYEFAVKPDLTVYYKASLDRIIESMAKEEREKDFYDSGMDIGMGATPLQSLKTFQKKLQEEYEGMSATYKFKEIDSEKSIHDQQNILRKLTLTTLK
jgi:dTMP kinase